MGLSTGFYWIEQGCPLDAVCRRDPLKWVAIAINIYFW